MPPGSDSAANRRRTCEWITLRDALRHFATYDGPTQSQQHIKPLHWYVTCRLVLEGGFHPDELTPRPPFTVHDRRLSEPHQPYGGNHRRMHESAHPVPGPCLRVLLRDPCQSDLQCVRVTTTHRALTPPSTRPQRHRARHGRQAGGNDLPLPCRIGLSHGSRRYSLRSEPIYEAISLSMVDVRSDQAGDLLDTFPPPTSPLHVERFFDVLYRHYDERNVVSAPDLATRNRRVEWSPDSPALTDRLPENLDYDIRISN